MFGVGAGLGGCALFGRRGRRGLLVTFEGAVFGGGEEELLRYLVFRLNLLIEAQRPQELVDLRATHIRQGNTVQLFVAMVEEDKLRVGSRDVLHHQVMVKRNILGHESFDLSQPVQLSSTT